MRVVFVGDVMLDCLPGKVIEKGGDPFEHFAPLFREADLVVGNLECVIATTGQLHALPQDDITRCAYTIVDVLARLHQIEPQAVGLAGFGRPSGYLGRQVRRWYDQWRRVQTRPLADIDAIEAELASLGIVGRTGQPLKLPTIHAIAKAS